MFGRWGRERRERIAEARAAAAKSERLSLVIDHLREEAAPIAAWAQQRYEQNHLTELFKSGRSR